MAQAIILPLIERGDFLPHEIFGVVGTKESVKRVADRMPKGIDIVCSCDPRADDVWDLPLKLLAVKPQQLPTIQNSLQNIVNKKSIKPSLLISLLAGVKVSSLEKIFSDMFCVRVVPNIPVLVGAGLTGFSSSKHLSSSDKLLVEKIFSPISEVLELPEKQLDAFLALTSSGPAYVALMVEALADGAVAAGLPRILAIELAQKTLVGTAKLLKEKNIHPGELKDMVSSPGGTTIAALRHLEKAGLRSALIEAVVVAAETSRKMS